MAACARCGREFKPEPETSIPGGLLYLVSHPLRSGIGFLAALFLIGGWISMGTYVGAALAGRDFSLPILSLSALFIVVLILMLILFRNWRQSRVSSRYCLDCRH